MKQLKIEVPKGYEIDKEKSTFENIVFKPVENNLPVNIGEVEERSWFIGTRGKIYRAIENKNDINNLSSKERAKAFLALMQLVELRDAYNGDWVADWDDLNQKKHLVYFEKNKEKKTFAYIYRRVLHFKSAELRDKFFETFKPLIEEAKELI